MASSLEVPKTMTEAPASTSYLARHYEKVFKEGLSFSGFERDRLFLNGGAGQFSDVSSVSGIDSPGDGRGVVLADLDNDGDADVFVHNVLGNRHGLFRNDVGDGNRWVRLLLEGRRSNRDAVGALVRASVRSPSGTRILTRTVQCGSGFGSASDRRILLGLGDATRVDALEVRWPSGLVESRGAVEAGRTVRLIEGDVAPHLVEGARARLGGAGASAALARGVSFPAVGLATVAGNRLERAAPLGLWALVNLWSPTCPPCLKEMPHLQTLWKRHNGRIAVVGIALVPAARRQAVVDVVRKLGITYPIALTPAELPGRLFGNGPIPIPTSVLVDPAGRVASVYQGLDDLSRLEADVARVADSR